MLRERSEHFIDALSQKPSLTPLYKNRRFTVEIQDGYERVWIELADGKCRLLDTEPLEVDITVSGDAQMIETLMDGRERMLLMDEEGRLEVDGTLRNLLALESLFVLTGDEADSWHHRA
ncbi:SCP2 sterol-binding domain-containing protein [Camelliibacillus cellulosilyticus]|uniref:SCP2 sterol-binding domain-containing protein n=1 Tax=Camelliibacillus cellulosilyticus TaxID=2174486 RepID=A0ABV9GP56_9BACL